MTTTTIAHPDRSVSRSVTAAFLAFLILAAALAVAWSLRDSGTDPVPAVRIADTPAHLAPAVPDRLDPGPDGISSAHLTPAVPDRLEGRVALGASCSSHHVGATVC